MIDIETVINGEFQPKDMMEALEAGVLIEDLQAKVDKGKANVFGYVLVRARNLYAHYHAQSEGWNAPLSWQESAAEQLNTEAADAISAGEVRGYTSKQVSTFKNAVRSLRKAMSEGADLMERDAAGEFVLSGKTKIEQWNKARQSELDAEKARLHAEASARLAEEQGLTVAGSITGAEGESTGTQAETVLDLIKDPDLRESVETYINYLADVEKQDPDEAKAMIGRGIHAVTKGLRQLTKALEQAVA